MRYGWLVVALVAGGCIEGEDPNSCHVDSDCSDGRLCSWKQQCELALFDLTVRWTFNGVAPTPESPGPCADFGDFRFGASDANGGFSETAVCEQGVAQQPRVPARMTTIGAAAYADDGQLISLVEMERGDASEVTIAFVLP